MQEFFPFLEVESKLQVTFKKKSLLMQAFVHRSFWNENQDRIDTHNERLEFLGDSVLGVIIADYLFCGYPDLDEGSLSTIRSQLVDAPACATYVQQLGIGKFLLLGKGEQLNKGKGRESILADLFEAVMGAIYLDKGLEKAREFFFSHFKTVVDQMISAPHRNWKAELQDFTQKYYQQVPIYEVLEESGPAHHKRFRVGVWINNKKVGEGEGSSKKEAQTEAAKAALQNIE